MSYDLDRLTECVSLVAAEFLSPEVQLCSRTHAQSWAVSMALWCLLSWFSAQAFSEVQSGVKLLTLLVQDQTLNNVRLVLRLFGLAGVTATVVGLDWSINQALLVVVCTMFAVVADEVEFSSI